MYQPITHLSNLDPTYDYYLYTPRRRRRPAAADPALAELRDQLEENNRLLRTLSDRSASNSGVNTPEGSQRSLRAHEQRGSRGSNGGQLVKVPRSVASLHEVSSPEIMTSVLNGHVMEPLLLQNQMEMRRRYDELEDKYRRLEDKVVAQKQQIKFMQAQKLNKEESAEKQEQLRSMQKQLEKLTHDIKLREKLAENLSKPSLPSHNPYASAHLTLPYLTSKYYPAMAHQDPGALYQVQKDVLLQNEVDLLHKELHALESMKYHLKY